MSVRIPLSAPDITQAEIDAVAAVLRTHQLSLGPELTAFERAMAEYHRMPDAVAVSSGTAGLHLSLIALDIGGGAEVLVPSFTFIAVANAVAQVGATPVFVDIDPATLNLDPALLEAAITPRTRAILVVHTFGVPAAMNPILEIARRHRLKVIEDACEAIGAEYDGLKVGSFGDLAVFGFYPNKQITTGEGGCVLAKDPDLAARLRSLRNQGRSPIQGSPDANWFDHVEIGYNFRLSDIASALGRVQLSRIDEILGLRRAAAERYHIRLSGIADLEVPPLSLPACTISWFVYVVRLPEREPGFRSRLQTALTARGIATGRYFAPIHRQPAWRHAPSATAARVPWTDSIAPRMLALPFFNRITAEQQEKVAQSLKSAIEEM
jgi:perosamine synthetase